MTDVLVALLVDSDDLFTCKQLAEMLGLGPHGYGYTYQILRRLESKGIVAPCYGITNSVLWHATPEAQAERAASLDQVEEVFADERP